MMNKIKVGIIGATSYTAGKLIQLLLSHPYTELVYLASDSNAGVPVESIHTFLTQLKQNLLFKETDYEKITEECDVVFVTKPHGYLHKYVQTLLDKGVKIIDLGADFRLKDPNLYKEWYGFEHKNKEFLKKAVYGLCEINKEAIASAQLLANPGCYATSILLGLVPALVHLKSMDTNTIVINAISGISGAGKSLKEGSMFINVDENIRLYKIGTHQHTAEIEQEAFRISGKKIKILFAPQIGPYKNGILSNIFFSINDDTLTAEDVYQIYKDFYKDKPFVRVYPVGSIPEVQTIRDTNFCDIGITVDARTKKCVITSVIDNIVKGASGEAIQNMNIIFGIDETKGLPYGEFFN